MIIPMLTGQLAGALLSTPCTDLQSLPIEHANITTVELVAEGPFTPPDAAQPAAAAPDAAAPDAAPLPAHCRVTMVLQPTSDSNIKVELWMPLNDWNGRFLAVGNGGWAGRIQGYADMQVALRRGYSTAATDTGHSGGDGPDGMFALGHPDKIVDFAYRAVHVMTVKSKQLIAAFYEPPLKYAYFKGCSTGGRQAVMAAQRYPGDFDGIIAGALANRHIHMHTASVAKRIRIARHPDEAISGAKAQWVTDAVMQACNTLQEGFLNNPRQCTFDFSELACGGADAEMCLSDAELRTVETHYGGLKNSAGEVIFAGQVLGNPMREQRAEEPGIGGGFDTVRILGFQDADYDWRTFDLDRDMPLIDDAVGFVDAINPDLRGFEGHGGKLLLYAGWADAVITPKNTVDYYENVLEEMGAEQSDWVRLFMVPGMGHCRGGDGPHTFDALAALEQWREEEVAPDLIIGSNPESGLERPLFPYPQFAEYDGSGPLNDSANWSCAAP